MGVFSRRRWLIPVLALGAMVTACTGRILGAGSSMSKTDPGTVNGSGATTGSGAPSDSSGTAGSGTTTGSGAATTLLTPRVRRLSNNEYDRSVQSLLLTTQNLGANFAPDTRQNDFTVNTAQTVDPVLAGQYQSAAQTLAQEAVTARLASLVPCGTQDDACAGQFITSFGRRAYRRPLTSVEHDALLAVYHAGIVGGAFQDGIELVITAVLQSAGFLYVTELGPGGTGAIQLDPYETASAISYLVTGGPPDDALLTAADQGALASADGREAQARRLLQTPQAAAQLRLFVEEWLNIDQLMSIARAKPDFSIYRADMLAETDGFIDEVMAHDGASVSALLGADYTVLPPDLAPFYGLQAGATPGARVSLSGTPRRGILTQASFLSVQAHVDGSAPVLRGVAVLRKVLCFDIPPPSGLKVAIVPPAPDPTLTTRQQYVQHAADAACSACHTTIDSIGFTFEGFDEIGAERTENGQKGIENGQPVDTSGAIMTGSDVDGPVADAAALASQLARSQNVSDCFARQAFRFAAGQRSDGPEATFDGLWKSQPAATRASLAEILVMYVRSDMFLKRSPS
jgi:Protein of unknown function (DUF1592)/Protein of unknown function (DUF1588)/Protein of unknown function (DUF1595)/Protein of unknown function (DUF1587)